MSRGFKNIFQKIGGGGGGGFEPPKAMPSDLQSDLFNHSGTPPLECL